MSNSTWKIGALAVVCTLVFPLRVFSEVRQTKTITGTGEDNVSASYVYKRTGVTGGTLRNVSDLEIPDLEPPLAYPAENITDTSFTARWTLVQDADGYALDVRRGDKIWEDGEIVVFNEDFSKVTTGTVSSPVRLGMQHNLQGMTKESGWEAMDCLAARGMIGLGGSGTSFGYSVLFLPPVDVSNKDGEFNIRLKLSGTAGDVIIADYTLDPSDFISSPDGPKEYVLKSANDECTFTFAAGTRFSSIKLSSKEKNKKPVFIDELSISHTLKRGELFYTSCFYEEFDDPNISSYEVTGIEVNKPGSLLAYDVLAYDMIYPVERVLNRSDWSDAVVISDMTPIQEVRTGEKSPVRVDCRTVYITGTDQETVRIYSVTGELVFQEKKVGETLTTELNPGMYVVRVGTQNIKILIR